MRTNNQLSSFSKGFIFAGFFASFVALRAEEGFEVSITQVNGTKVELSVLGTSQIDTQNTTIVNVDAESLMFNAEILCKDFTLTSLSSQGVVKVDDNGSENDIVYQNRTAKIKLSKPFLSDSASINISCRWNSKEDLVDMKARISIPLEQK